MTGKFEHQLSNLLSSRELRELLTDGSACLLDCSWHLPSKDRDPKQEYLLQHIPRALFFDVDEICDKHAVLPHMLPSAKAFSIAVSALGISNDSLVVCYDSYGLFSAARVWWMFKVFGHSEVYVLNGGLPLWIAEGGDTASGEETTLAGNYIARFNKDAIATLAQVIENTRSNEAILIDARPLERFTGEKPEPRPELRSGHIPGSHSLPYTELIEGGQLKNKPHLLNAFEKRGIKDHQDVITSCGSGVTAAILTLALAECGFEIGRLYDGAWTEWASKMPDR